MKYLQQKAHLKVLNLVNPFGVVNEGVTVVLEVLEDLLVTSSLEVTDRVRFVPSTHEVFVPRLERGTINTILVAALEDSTVGNGDVKVTTGKVALELVRGLEAGARETGGGAGSKLGAIGGGVGGISISDEAVRVVGALAVDISVGGEEVHHIGLGTMSFRETTPPGLGPTVFAVETVSLAVVRTTLLIFLPALTVDIYGGRVAWVAWG